jgi:acetyl-CoA acetyltransferase
MSTVYICDTIRTPFGRYGGRLSSVRTDDLAAIPIRALVERNPAMDWSRLDEVFLGCANQAGEDNRNVGRVALLLAGLSQDVPGNTINRLCDSGLDAVSLAARSIASGEISTAVAGGVESMSRAPFVMGKSDSAFSRESKLEDTTHGWRFVNPAMKRQYGTDSMPEMTENVAAEYSVSREHQDLFAFRSQDKARLDTLRKRSAPWLSPERKARLRLCFRTNSRGRTPNAKRWRRSNRSSGRTAL